MPQSWYLQYTLLLVIAVIPYWLRFLQVCLRVCLLIFFLVGFAFQFCCRSDFLLIYVVFQLWCRFEVLLSFCVIPVIFWSIMSFASYGVVYCFMAFLFVILVVCLSITSVKRHYPFLLNFICSYVCFDSFVVVQGFSVVYYFLLIFCVVVYKLPAVSLLSIVFISFLPSLSRRSSFETKCLTHVTK